MQLLVLGSAAGGGFPQWNCNCRNCIGLRQGTLRSSSRTQSSVAVSTNGIDWAIINASPDISTQMRNCASLLQPGRAARDSGIRGVVLVDSQLDHTLGLASLREGAILDIYCTTEVRQDLTDANPLLRVLENYCDTRWHEITLSEGLVFQVGGLDDLEFNPLPVAGKAPPYSTHRESPRRGDNIALGIRDYATRKSVFYAPGLGGVNNVIWERMQTADAIMVDGSFWSDDEMIVQGLGRKRARDMGHLALSGEVGLLSYLRELPARVRKILIHVNNTNPILNEESAERRLLEEAGIEVAYDGMSVVL